MTDKKAYADKLSDHALVSRGEEHTDDLCDRRSS
jgi:hypothetical protein